MSQLTLRRTVLRISWLQIAIIVLAVITGLIHLDKAMMMGFFGGGHPMGTAPHGGGHPGAAHPGPMLLIFQNLPLLFVLNFIGYIVLVAALYLPIFRRWQRIIRWLLIAFTAVTIIAYFALLGFSPNPTGYMDKIIELTLVVLLLVEDRQAASATDK